MDWDRILGLVQTNPQIAAAAIIAISLVVAWVVDLIITGIVAVWVRRTKATADDELIALLHKPIRVSVLLFGLGIATRTLELPKASETVVIGLLCTIAVVIWLVLGFRIAGLAAHIFSGGYGGPKIYDPKVVPLVDNSARVTLVGIAVYLFFLVWNIDVTAWVASAGIVGIAVGFAAKDSVANLFGGVFILTDGPYKIGDYINLDSGERGQVTHIGIRTTRLLTRDDLEVTIPNSVMANATIVNESGGRWPRSRVRAATSVAYGSNLETVKRVLLEIAESNELICDDPEPRVRFRSFGDSGLNFELLGWIDDPEIRGRVIDQLLTTIHDRFAEAGVEIPYPKRDLYIKEMANPGPDAAPQSGRPAG